MKKTLLVSAPIAAALAIALVSVHASAKTHKPSVADAEAFVARANAELLDLSNQLNRAQWVQATYITQDTEAISAAANDAFIAATTRLIHESTAYDGLKLPAPVARQMKLLRLSLSMPAPSDPAQRKELTQVAAELEGNYGAGKYCPKSGPYAGKCLGQSEMEQAFATQRDPKVLQDLWVGWHDLGARLEPRFEKLVTLSNAGARELGFKDVGALWRSSYDMSPEDFDAEVNRLWDQVRPLYESLHAYVRTRLAAKYGAQAIAPGGMLPAHLLGNPWAQEWDAIYDLVSPPGARKSYDLTALLESHHVGPLDMVRYGERFFTSLGFAPLPQTFWERSMFVKPADRDVVCHASAWDVDNADDLRLKMCIKARDEDFVTVHHELGHNFYQRAYDTQPYLFRSGANDGFHESIGDTIALSITPEYLHRVALLEKVPAPSRSEEVSYLLKEALDKVAFLPFGLLIDEWRWKVYSGQVGPADYEKAWWELRAKYQGIAPPVARGPSDFDPGAKYHVPANVPYVRYFLSHLLQFQMYRGLCRAAGYQGPLHRCSFYDSKEAGKRLGDMLAMGQSQPWPDALAVVTGAPLVHASIAPAGNLGALTGERRIDGGALMEYFAPLKEWLDEQNAGKAIGWSATPSATP